MPPAPRARTFLGYARPDGRVGTRNYVAVISTVNCSASVSRAIAGRFGPEALRPFPNIDGVIALTHKTGCGMQESGPDHAQLARTLAGFASHPNIAACAFVGLGCEVASAVHPMGPVRLPGRPAEMGCRRGTPVPGTALPGPAVLSIQGCGGISRTVEAGARVVAALLARANEARRSEVPAARIVLGLQCGGSDAYSGVTANPALGVASDMLVAAGGTAVLAETPEIYGAEHLLTRRAVSKRVADALLERIRWWEGYTSLFGVTMDSNPSPGNKEGGLTTIYEKSLGAVAKGGSTALAAVYGYAEPVTASGLVFMDTPGYDPVSLTGVVAGGATICAFTTGRGSVYGCKPSPCIKIATTSALYGRMESDMDIDAGTVLRGEPLDRVGDRIFEMLLRVASGERTKSEIAGVGDEEFAPWSIGPTL